MQQAADTMRRPRGSDLGPVNLHAGIQVGTVVWEGDDVFGAAVNEAARLVSLAKPRQILTTRTTVQTLRPEHRENARRLYRTVLRGTAEEVELHEILWELQGATALSDSPAVARILDAAKSRIELLLRLGRRKVTLDASHPGVSLGRLPHNDLVVPGSAVSRYHARIEHRRGNFVLIDQSANGTFLAPDGGPAVALRGQEAVLSGLGMIGLGAEPDPRSRGSIGYELRSR
jgi:hypothetical protein